MIEAQTGLFTVAVFQDVAWATKALEALKQAGFSHDGTTILAKATDDAAALIEKTFGRPGDRLEFGAIGAAGAHGPLKGPRPEVHVGGRPQGARREGGEGQERRHSAPEAPLRRGGGIVGHASLRGLAQVGSFRVYKR